MRNAVNLQENVIGSYSAICNEENVGIHASALSNFSPTRGLPVWSYGTVKVHGRVGVSVKIFLLV